MQASVKLGLAFAAAASMGLAQAQHEGRVKVQFPNLPDQAQGGQVAANPGSEKAPPAPRANDRLRNAGPVNGAATMPDVAKTPTPSGPVPIPYPNTSIRAQPPVTLLPLPQPILRPAPTPVPAGPAKIDAITIKQR